MVGGGCLGFKPDTRASADVLLGRKHILSEQKQFWLKAWGFRLQLCCLDLEVSFLFVSSAAALILVSLAGGKLESVGKCPAWNSANSRLGVA